jgi:acid phosphatase type 7
MKNFVNYFKKEKWMNPVRNSCGASNPAGIIPGSNPAAEHRAFAAPKWLSPRRSLRRSLGRPRRQGSISNGVKMLLLFGAVLFLSFPSYAASIKEVDKAVKQVQSIESPFQFAIIGDSRDGEKVYTRLIGKILERSPQFIIHLGDMVSRPNVKEWDPFFEISKPIQVPFFPVVGNHDVGTSKGEEIYLKQFLLPDRKTYYAFEAGNSLFIILDSEKGKERIIGEQRSWLDHILTSSKAPLKLIFIHRPFFPPIDSFKLGRAMDRHPSDRDDLHRLFLRTGVKAVIAADDHRYDRTQQDNILYLISGGGGAPLYNLKDNGGYFHYIWVSVQTGKMEGEVIDLEGKTKDKFVIE